MSGQPLTAVRALDRISRMSDFVAPVGGVQDGQILIFDAGRQKFTTVTPAAGTLPSYQHNQPTPDVAWTVNHNLGFKPNVTVIDTSGSVIIADIAHVSANQLVINFSAAIGGVAYCS